MIGDPGDKARTALTERFETTDLERYHDYSYGDLVDAFWAGYTQAVKECRPDD